MNRLRASPLQTASRIAAAAIGGYALSVAASVLLSRLLEMPRANGVTAGLLASFAVFAAAAIWAFAAASALRAWAGLLVPAGLFAGLAWYAGPLAP